MAKSNKFSCIICGAPVSSLKDDNFRFVIDGKGYWIHHLCALKFLAAMCGYEDVIRGDGVEWPELSESKMLKSN